MDLSAPTILPPGFESQAHRQRFYNYSQLVIFYHVKRTKLNKKRPGLSHFLNDRICFLTSVCLIKCFQVVADDGKLGTTSAKYEAVNL